MKVQRRRSLDKYLNVCRRRAVQMSIEHFQIFSSSDKLPYTPLTPVLVILDRANAKYSERCAMLVAGTQV